LKKVARISILSIIGAGVVAIIVLYAMGKIEPIANKFIRTLFPTFAETLPLIDSVAENLTSSWASLFFNIYIMVFFLPLGFYFCIKKPNEKTVFLLLLGLTGVYFGGSMVRLALIVTPAAAVVTGYTLDEILRPFALINQERFTISRRKRRAAKQIGRDIIAVAYIFVAAALMLTVIFGGRMLERQYYLNHELTPRLDPSTPGQGAFMAHDYQETFEFLSNNIAPYAPGEKPPIVMSWWDYGYQIRALGNCTTLVDNATINSTQIGMIGAMLIHNETSALKLMQKYGVDYILVLSPGTIGSDGHDIYKSQWMMQIAEEYANEDLKEYGITYSDYYNSDFDSENPGFTNLFWNSVIYKLCAYLLNSDGYASDPQNPINPWRGPGLQNAPNVNTLTHFDLVFQSKFALLRIYRPLYDTMT
jgi:dolichyl-diphosphooligosaccharide--protein glycosyltransferase